MCFGSLPSVSEAARAFSFYYSIVWKNKSGKFQKIMQTKSKKLEKKLENWEVTPPIFPYTAGGDGIR